jgi:hypothetical protein
MPDKLSRQSQNEAARKLELLRCGQVINVQITFSRATVAAQQAHSMHLMYAVQGEAVGCNCSRLARRIFCAS